MTPRGLRRWKASTIFWESKGGKSKEGKSRGSKSRRPRIFITFLPGSDLAETTETAVRLAREGFVRCRTSQRARLRARRSLKRRSRLGGKEAGVEEVLLVGGAVAAPLGPFAESMQVLRWVCWKTRHQKVGFAAHPEGSPDITLRRARARLSKRTTMQKTATLIAIWSPNSSSKCSCLAVASGDPPGGRGQQSTEGLRRVAWACHLEDAHYACASVWHWQFDAAFVETR